ncbi:hypothetical protein WJX73_010828 [Symbiochloris irregularis]|uniref:Uncharacterized protein n=1 Tax=Symbiochloris irregularis TaxID=706552 RepID=A0AAW1PFI2_9CHLO
MVAALSDGQLRVYPLGPCAFRSLHQPHERGVNRVRTRDGCLYYYVNPGEQLAVHGEHFQWWPEAHSLSVLYVDDSTDAFFTAVVHLDTCELEVRPLLVTQSFSLFQNQPLLCQPETARWSPCGKWLLLEGKPPCGGLAVPRPIQAFCALDGSQRSLGHFSVARFVQTHRSDGGPRPALIAAEILHPPNLRAFQVYDLNSGRAMCHGPLPMGTAFNISRLLSDLDHCLPPPPPDEDGAVRSMPGPFARKSWIVWVENPKHAGTLYFHEDVQDTPDDLDEFEHKPPPSPRCVRTNRNVTIRHRGVQGLRPIMSPDGRMLAHVHRSSRSETLLLSIQDLPSGDKRVKRGLSNTGSMPSAILWSPCSNHLAIHVRKPSGRDTILVTSLGDARTWEPFRSVSPWSPQVSFGMVAWAHDSSKLLAQRGDTIYEADFIL